jgi:type II secretory pathway pseudopilin PulG
MTLIELVVAIVIITMAAGTIIGLIATMSRTSAEAMTHSQSASIANAYMNEVLSQPYSNVMSYDGRSDLGAVDRLGTLIPNTAEYRVNISVQAARLGAGPNHVAAGQSRRIQIQVIDPMGDQLWLTGFKTNY